MAARSVFRLGPSLGLPRFPFGVRLPENALVGRALFKQAREPRRAPCPSADRMDSALSLSLSVSVLVSVSVPAHVEGHTHPRFAHQPLRHTSASGVSAEVEPGTARVQARIGGQTVRRR